MLALLLPLNFLDVVPDLPDLFEAGAGGTTDPESMAFFSLSHVVELCPVIPQNVQPFFFHMHLEALWFGSRQRVQTFDSLLSSCLLYTSPSPRD